MHFPNIIPSMSARCSIVFMAGALVSAAEPPAAPPPAAPPVKLPGISIDVAKRNVDVDATVCLENGALELIACTKDSKEHESLIVIAARPSHIHAALLLLGAKNGTPAMRKPVDDEAVRWVDVPPSGDLIDVFLVCPDADGKMIERPLGDFVRHVSEQDGEPDAKKAAGKFPSSFLFAGSHIQKNDKEPPLYLAESSGNIISVATFGDELLCLPEIESQDNGSLAWEIDTKHVPKLGTKVILRLHPHKQPKVEPKK